ncbi:MAG: helix-turn-helix domain-containing protein [Myxococcaceae bacterium]
MSFFQVPDYIFNSSISLRAKFLWMLMSKNAAGATELWIKQAALAEQLHCSRSSIGRALRVLIEAGFITDLKRRHLSRYKTYGLPNNHETGFLSPSPDSGEGLRVRSPKTKRNEYQQEICTPIPEENLKPRAKELWTTYKDIWRNQFSKLDGQSGRPYLEACVQKAANDLSDGMYGGKGCTQVEFIESWLKTATKMYCQEPN